VSAHGGREQVELHGQPVSFRRAGSGPSVVVLVHGITSSSRTWRSVMPLLAEHHTVIAPDLLGHGRSAKPRGDYSLGAYASGIRDLLAVLGIARATVVGHSLGGGVAMQFGYQFPERLERMVLVDSGGLGRDVSAVLRAATLPGAEVVLPLLFGALPRRAAVTARGLLGRAGLKGSEDLRGIAEGLESLGDAEARRAFVLTARSVIDPRGQRVDARDRLYLAAEVPVLFVWGERDRLIPLRHGQAAHALVPGSRLEVVRGAGHFPFNDDPGRFAAVVSDFVRTTPPAVYDQGRLEALLRAGPAGAGARAPGA
jgi:pimeloyl-ACP methyl ester carboxylesterase